MDSMFGTQVKNKFYMKNYALVCSALAPSCQDIQLLTRMNSNANPHGEAREMLQLKGPHEAEDVQGHLGNVHCMPVAISHRQAAGHHVGIADGFDLWKHVLMSGSAPQETDLNRTLH